MVTVNFITITVPPCLPWKKWGPHIPPHFISTLGYTLIDDKTQKWNLIRNKYFCYISIFKTVNNLSLVLAIL